MRNSLTLWAKEMVEKRFNEVLLEEGVWQENAEKIEIFKKKDG